MSTIAVLGGGAFGTALAVILSGSGRAITLWARDTDAARDMQATRQSGPRLPGVGLPPALTVSGNLGDVDAEIVLLAVPMAALGSLLDRTDCPAPKTFVACMKGIDPATGQTPSQIIGAARPAATVAILTGPSFAADIAGGLPTALTLACADDAAGRDLQENLTTSSLRLYRTTDARGAELGGAIKNVIAIAAGVAMGAGLGESARAAVIARGMAEMLRVAEALGATPETLFGLSGLGDLVLTATSEKSRNYRAGLAIGADQPLPSQTTEGLATARALADIAAQRGIEAPIAETVTRLIEKTTTVTHAVDALLSRPLKKE